MTIVAVVPAAAAVAVVVAVFVVRFQVRAMHDENAGSAKTTLLSSSDAHTTSSVGKMFVIHRTSASHFEIALSA